MSYIASMVDKNIIVNNPTLKSDSYFVIADSKTQRGNEVSNDDQHELFHQTPSRIDCKTPDKAAVSNSTDHAQENLSENISDLTAEFLAFKSFVMDELYSINVNLDRARAEQCDQTKYLRKTTKICGMILLQKI